MSQLNRVLHVEFENEMGSTPFPLPPPDDLTTHARFYLDIRDRTGVKRRIVVSMNGESEGLTIEGVDEFDGWHQVATVGFDKFPRGEF